VRITGIEVSPLDLRPRVALTVAYGSYPVLEYALISLQTDEGLIGLGEASPDPEVTGETRGAVMTALREAGEYLAGKNPFDIAEIIGWCEERIGLFPSAMAAIDMALYDLMGKSLGVPVYRLIGGKAREGARLYPVIPLDSPDVMAETARGFAALGADRLKVKVGTDPAEDLRRIEAVRSAAGDAVTLYIDVNQGWRNAAAAIEAIGSLSGFTIGWIEQPVKAVDLEGLAEVTAAVETPIMADESCIGPEDLLSIVNMKAADMINVKLMKCGGIHRALRMLSIAEAAGLPCILGSMGESSVGSAAGLHLMIARKGLAACELIGPLFIDNDPAEGFPVDPATLVTRLPSGAGLGVRLK